MKKMLLWAGIISFLLITGLANTGCDFLTGDTSVPNAPKGVTVMALSEDSIGIFECSSSN